MFGWRTEKAINTADGIQKLQRALQEVDTVIIGAGAGLSTSAGFTYSGERFRKYFSDFAEKYGFSDMYSGGFYPYKTLEEHWAYWSRYIWINRYQNPSKPVYDKLYELVREKDYFVLTTNVDHCFQKAGFDKHRLFYTQGDMDCSSAVSPAVRKPGIMKKASEICCWRRDIRLVRVASCLNRMVRIRKASGEQESVGQFPRSWFLIVPIAGNR